MIKFYITAVFFLVVNQLHAQIKLPSIISNDMVLQQKTNVLLWGQANKDNIVAIQPEWSKKKYTTTADAQGNWKIKISTPEAGGPYQIAFKSEGKDVIIKNILIGEVWLCSGQSNMEMPLKGYNKQPVLNADSLIADADHHPDIRIFRVPKVVSSTPLKDCKGQWEQTNSNAAPNFSAIAYQYAKILNEKLHVPVGIISTYWGGTAIQSWMSEGNLKQFPEAWSSARLDTITNPEKDPEKSPSILFNSMIKPIVNYTIKGFVWYQGESNRENPLFYRSLMPAMVKEWRTLWHLGNLPFYYVQIAPYGYSDPSHKLFPAILRESQLKVMNEIPNAGMAVTIDVGKEKFIHPPDKTTVSNRLSYWALAKTYHQKQISYESPVLKKMEIKGGKAILSFNFAKQGLTSYNKDLTDFEIAGKDQVFHDATAIIVNENQVEVQSVQVTVPVAVRYAFKNWVRGNLYNKGGLPASSFRTDDWNTVQSNK